MAGYTKLFSEIIMSTVWREPDHVRILWITMLALRDRFHTVNSSLPGLADAARISLPQCEEALEILSSPDAYSRSTEHEGRRIKKVDGGWFILNGEKYRNKMSLDERREYQRIKQKEYRERKKEEENSLENNACQQDDNKTVNYLHSQSKSKSKSKSKTLTTLSSKLDDSKKEPSQVEELHEYFISAFKGAFKKDYIPSFGRDRKLLKQALGGASFETLRLLIDRYFDPDHSYKGNCDVPSFYKAINRLQKDGVKHGREKSVAERWAEKRGINIWEDDGEGDSNSRGVVPKLEAKRGKH